MSKSNAAENKLLLLVLNQVTWSGVATSAGGTLLYLALHSSDPGEAGDQTTNEATYTSYARVAISRTSSGFTVSGSTGSNTSEIVFPTCTGSPQTLTHWSLGLAASGPSEILYKGIMNDEIPVANTIAPRFEAGQLTITED